MHEPVLAVIDIGSNSIKLLVAAPGPQTGPKIKVLFQTTLETRISGGLGQSKSALSETGIAAGVNAIKQLLEMARAYAPDPVGFKLIHEILAGAIFEDGVAYALVPYAQYKQAPTGTSIRHDVGQAIRYIQGVRVSFVILEKDNDEKYLSIRCHDGYDVAQIAAQFGGGGHKVAAGGNLSRFDSLEAAAEAVLKLAKAEANKPTFD